MDFPVRLKPEIDIRPRYRRRVVFHLHESKKVSGHSYKRGQAKHLFDHFINALTMR